MRVHLREGKSKEQGVSYDSRAGLTKELIGGNDLESEQQRCLDCYLLKAELLKAQTEGPSTSEVQELHRENAEMRTKIGALQEKEIKDNDEANARLTLII